MEAMKQAMISAQSANSAVDADDPLAEIRAARERITPGEWEWNEGNEDLLAPASDTYVLHIETANYGEDFWLEVTDKDAAWIAASPRYVDTLLARVEEAIEWAKKGCMGCDDTDQFHCNLEAFPMPEWMRPE